MTKYPSATSGFCTRCRTTHTLPMERAKTAALDLIERLDREKRLDFHVPPGQADPRFSTDYLFGKARGKMFGVMVCRRADGTVLTVKSFSGQYNGQWHIDGWAPPLFDLQQWHRVNDDTEKEIKRMGAKIDALEKTSPRAGELIQRSKSRSRELMKALHQIYTLHNFRSERRTLADAYTGENGIPNGTADCCAPKLLDFAARNALLPLGLAEFYYGRPNKQGDRIHGTFYPSCPDKCAPILGFMLCGLQDRMEEQPREP